jgi:hypothetical protein
MEPASMSGGVSSVMGSGGVGGMVSGLLQQSDNKQIGLDILMAGDIKIFSFLCWTSCYITHMWYIHQSQLFVFNNCVIKI